MMWKLWRNVDGCREFEAKELERPSEMLCIFTRKESRGGYLGYYSVERFSHFRCDTLLRIEIFINYMVRTQRRSLLDTNLTKWLSKCEGSLLEGKGKIQVYGDWWWRAEIKWTWKETYKHDGNRIDNGGK